MNNKKDKNKLIVAIFSFSILTVFCFFIASILVFFLDRNEFKNLNLPFLISLYKKLITIKIFILLELLNFAFSFIILWHSYWYTAKEIQITDDIIIPERAGQNQHGSAKFANKKDFDNIFDSVVIDVSEFKKEFENGKNIYNFIEQNKNDIDNLIDTMDI